MGPIKPEGAVSRRPQRDSRLSLRLSSPWDALGHGAVAPCRFRRSDLKTRSKRNFGNYTVSDTDSDRSVREGPPSSV